MDVAVKIGKNWNGTSQTDSQYLWYISFLRYRYSQFNYIEVKNVLCICNSIGQIPNWYVQNALLAASVWKLANEYLVGDSAVSKIQKIKICNIKSEYSSSVGETARGTRR